MPKCALLIQTKRRWPHGLIGSPRTVGPNHTIHSIRQPSECHVGQPNGNATELFRQESKRAPKHHLFHANRRWLHATHPVSRGTIRSRGGGGGVNKRQSPTSALSSSSHHSLRVSSISISSSISSSRKLTKPRSTTTAAGGIFTRQPLNAPQNAGDLRGRPVQVRNISSPPAPPPVNGPTRAPAIPCAVTQRHRRTTGSRWTVLKGTRDPVDQGWSLGKTVV